MSRAYAAFIGSAALLAAGTAFAGPCEQLAGARWLFHVEGGSPAQVVTGVMDFRDGVGNTQDQSGLVFYAATSAPFPAFVAGVPLAYGTSGWGRWVQCTPQPGNIARLSRAITVDLAISADGRSAVATGYYGGASGWATREPANAALPVTARRPRN